MPRRRINNGTDAANLLADCVVRASRGEMPAHQLHAINCAVATYGNLLKARRHEQLSADVRQQIDEIFGENKGAALYFRRKLAPPLR